MDRRIGGMVIDNLDTNAMNRDRLERAIVVRILISPITSVKAMMRMYDIHMASMDVKFKGLSAADAKYFRRFLTSFSKRHVVDSSRLAKARQKILKYRGQLADYVELTRDRKWIESYISESFINEG